MSVVVLFLSFVRFIFLIGVCPPLKGEEVWYCVLCTLMCVVCMLTVLPRVLFWNILLYVYIMYVHVL